MRKAFAVLSISAATLLAVPALSQQTTRTEEDFECLFVECTPSDEAEVQQPETADDGSWEAPTSKGFDVLGSARRRQQTAQGTTARPAARTQQPQRVATQTVRTRAAPPASRSRVSRAPAPGAQPAARVERRSNLSLGFMTGSAVLTPEARADAVVFAAALRNSPSLRDSRFRIEGHTDSQGGRAANLELSRQRAQALVDVLVANGVDASRLEARGMAYDQPLPGRRASDPANRRVEAVRLP